MTRQTADASAPAVFFGYAARVRWRPFKGMPSPRLVVELPLSQKSVARDPCAFEGIIFRVNNANILYLKDFLSAFASVENMA